MKTEDGSQPLENPKLEIYVIEQAAGMTEHDAREVSGMDWEMPIEPGEKVTAKRSRLAIQILRRVDARLAVLAELERGCDPVEHKEFLARNRRAAAELNWVRMVVAAGGVEPVFDEQGELIERPKRRKLAAQTEHHTQGGTL